MADVLIRGLEMPKKDEILVFDEWHGKVYARSTANTGTRRYEVVSLPEGHGRPLTEPPEEGRVTKEDLFAAVRTIKDYCKSRDDCGEPQNDRCPFFTKFGATWCVLDNCVPCSWPDHEEGGAEDGT